MKKLLCIFLVVACMLPAILAGCGTTEEVAAPATDPTAIPTTPSTPTDPATAPTTPSSPTESTFPPREDIPWDTDGTLKILAIGNSFSVDCMQYVFQIAQANGVENIKLGNLYVGGCPLKTHVANAQADAQAYKYYTNDNGTWTSVSNYKMSDAIISENWDFVSFQQASPVSGYADTYDDLVKLMNLVEPLCTNKGVKFVWHMTWAYQANSTNSSFENYGKNQEVMYNSIVSAVQTKIATNSRIDVIIPNGTAVQNARTSYVGDTLTRDGYHLSYDEGRKLAGLGVVDALIGINWENIDLTSVISDLAFLRVAEESVKNAISTPYAVTNSRIQTLTDIIDPAKYEEVELTLYKNKYWQSTKGTELTGVSGTKEKYFATEKFTKDSLPVGSIIYVAEGWQYRPEAWVNDALNASADRPDNITAIYVQVTEAWWGEWTSRGFNICMKNGTVLTDYTEEQIQAVFKIYVPKA